MKNMGEEIEIVCEKCKEDFSNKKRAYKLIIDGEGGVVCSRISAEKSWCKICICTSWSCRG